MPEVSCKSRPPAVGILTVTALVEFFLSVQGAALGKRDSIRPLVAVCMDGGLLFQSSEFNGPDREREPPVFCDITFTVFGTHSLGPASCTGCRNLVDFVDLLLTQPGGMQIPHKISLAGH
jgi:hypothetical protein